MILAHEIGARLDERQVHLVGHAGQPTVRQAGDAVLLLDQQRPPPDPRGQRHGRADVSAGAEHDVGPLAAHEPDGLQESHRHRHRRCRPSPPGVTWESASQDVTDLESRLRHGDGLEAAAAADEQDVGVLAHAPQLLGDRDPGEHVAPRASAGDHDLHATSRVQRRRSSDSRTMLTELTR